MAAVATIWFISGFFLWLDAMRAPYPPGATLLNSPPRYTGLAAVLCFARCMIPAGMITGVIIGFWYLASHLSFGWTP